MAHVRSDVERDALVDYIEAGSRLHGCKGCPIAYEIYRLAALNLRQHTRPRFAPARRHVLDAGVLPKMPARQLAGVA